MLLHAKNGTVMVGDTDMDYISYGSGKKYLIILPGLGDGFITVKGKAFPFAMAYSIFAKDYKVFVFSRKNGMKNGCTTRDMAKDLMLAMRTLGIKKANVLGVSQGGMVAQYLAIDFPEVVNKLVLAVTISKQNETIQNVVSYWIKLARLKKYKDIIVDTAEKSYSEKYLKRYRYLYPLLGNLGKPKDFTRFLIQANACLQHNSVQELEQIKCPTFIIGGGCDKIVGSKSSREIAQKIKNSQFFLYQDLGHAAYEEAKDFNERVLNFPRSDGSVSTERVTEGARIEGDIK